MHFSFSVNRFVSLQYASLDQIRAGLAVGGFDIIFSSQPDLFKRFFVANECLSYSNVLKFTQF